MQQTKTPDNTFFQLDQAGDSVGSDIAASSIEHSPTNAAHNCPCSGAVAVAFNP